MVVGVGLLGCGVVGSAVVRGVQGLAAPAELAVVAVAVRDPMRPRDCVLPAGILTTQTSAVVEDPAVQVVVEVMGGLEPAAGLVERALDLGKPVVTANKALLGLRGPELVRRARERGVPLLFEAAVAGAVPVIRGLDGLREAGDLYRIDAVLNGTTTFMLSHLAATGGNLEEALAEARRLGYAEADASRDLDGTDSADKLAVLVQYLFGEPLRSDDIHRVGIEGLGQEDLGGGGGRCWRLVATAMRGGCARVEPVALPVDHPFARLTGPENAVAIRGRRCGTITMVGAGAGGDATASSILADVLAASRHLHGLVAV